MNKIIVVLGLLAIFFIDSSVQVDCPDEDENSTATYYPHETECGKFYECHYGVASLFDCAPGTYWDSRQNVCSSEVDCGNLSTSTVSPTQTPTDPPATTPPPPTTAAPPTDPPQQNH